MGFRGYRQDGKSFITWWNANTRQSVQAVTREGRMKRFERITEGSLQLTPNRQENIHDPPTTRHRRRQLVLVVATGVKRAVR
jgi:hypothetical protein